MNAPDPLPLRTIEVPREVIQVKGCSCGGLEWHVEGCSIWRLPRDQALAAIDSARAREQAFGDELNRKLRESLARRQR
jgi:hypothetical protein